MSHGVIRFLNALFSVSPLCVRSEADIMAKTINTAENSLIFLFLCVYCVNTKLKCDVSGVSGVGMSRFSGIGRENHGLTPTVGGVHADSRKMPYFKVSIFFFISSVNM